MDANEIRTSNAAARKGRVIDLAAERAARAQRRQIFSDCSTQFDIWKAVFNSATVRWMKEAGQEWVRRGEQPEFDREYSAYWSNGVEIAEAQTVRSKVRKDA